MQLVPAYYYLPSKSDRIQKAIAASTADSGAAGRPMLLLLTTPALFAAFQLHHNAATWTAR
jgi:hypothetical protein